MSHDEGAVCLCVADHRPPILEYHRHHVRPAALGGSDDPSNLVFLCPSQHTNVHELLRMMFAAGRVLSHHELSEAQDRPVSRYAARIARAGYEATTGAIT